MKRILFVFVTLLIWTTPMAQANTIFVGIGNDGFKNDINFADRSLSPYASVHAEFDQNGAMLGELSVDANDLRAGQPDVLIFYYAGHGQTKADPDDRGDTDLQIGTFAAGTTPVTDDQLTSTISDINGKFPTAGIMVILDACHAGQAVDDSNDLASVDAFVVGSARKDECASEDSAVAGVFNAAFKRVKGDFEADSNHDGNVTLQELQDFMISNIAFYKGRGTKGTPFFLNFGSNNMNAIVVSKPVGPATPEPATLVLLGSGILGLIARKRRS